MKPLVVDASAVADLLLLRPRAEVIADRMRAHQLYAPELIVAEVMSVLRGWLLSGQITEFRADQALRDFGALTIARASMKPLAERAWNHRHNISSYDAMYIALAESLGCQVMTGDAKLARTVGARAFVP